VTEVLQRIIRSSPWKYSFSVAALVSHPVFAADRQHRVRSNTREDSGLASRAHDGAEDRVAEISTPEREVLNERHIRRESAPGRIEPRSRLCRQGALASCQGLSEGEAIQAGAEGDLRPRPSNPEAAAVVACSPRRGTGGLPRIPDAFAVLG
jgi:hypothetical protein